MSFPSDIGQRRKLFIMWASSIVLILLVLAATITLTTPKPLPSSHHSFSRTSLSSGVVDSACRETLYPTLCQSALSDASKKPPKNSDDAFGLSLLFAMDRARSVLNMASNITQSHQNMASMPSPMHDCMELLDMSMDQLGDVIDPSKAADQHDIDTWLSAAMTNLATCKDSLSEVSHPKFLDSMSSHVDGLTQCISNALALHQRVKRGGKKGKKPKNPPEDSKFPGWMTVADRKLIEDSPSDIKAHAVVAGDGSGTHKTIGEALAFVSLKSSSGGGGGGGGGGGRTVIYIKAGVYKENIIIQTKQKNVMLMGDGKGKSVIIGSKSVGGGTTTYQSATVGANGAGFIAKGLTIINNSGPQKNQAVALRVGADKAVVYQCSIQGYQDTLYAHSNRQFYRDNDIYGTVDFIFGNAAAVIQNCLIQPRKPGGGQRNSITAQGRLDPNQNTGLSIHRCKIAGSSDLGGTPTYLGRPWHKYSRTVFMASYLDGSIDSRGWEPWSGDFALSTLYYGEYANTGPGSSTSGRVKWPGVHSSLSASEASKFTVGNFIFGDSWLPGTGVSFDSGL